MKIIYLSKTKEFHINTQQIHEEQNLGYVKKQCKVVLCTLNSPRSIKSKHFCFWRRYRNKCLYFRYRTPI